MSVPTTTTLYERVRFIVFCLIISVVFMEPKTERQAAIVHQALIHTLNQLRCILLPAVPVVPDGLMANESKVELLIRVCGTLRDKT